MNIVRTSSVLVTRGSWRVNKMVTIFQVLFIYHIKSFCPKRGKLRSRQKSILQVYLRKSSSTLKSFILLFSLFRTSICLPNYCFKNCAVYSSSLVQYCSFQSMTKFCSEWIMSFYLEEFFVRFFIYFYSCNGFLNLAQDHIKMLIISLERN